MSHSVGEAPQRIAEKLGLSKVLCIHRRFRDGDQPLALVTAYLPPGMGEAVEPLLSRAPGAETTNAMETSYTMWEQRLGVHIARATMRFMRPAHPSR